MPRVRTSVLIAALSLTGLLLAQTAAPLPVGPASSPPAATSPAGQVQIPATLFRVIEWQGGGDPHASVMRFYPVTTTELFVPSVNLTLRSDGQVRQPPPDAYAKAVDRPTANEPIADFMHSEPDVQRLADFLLTPQEVQAMQQSFELQQKLAAIASLTWAVGYADLIVTAKIEALARPPQPSALGEIASGWELKVRTASVYLGKPPTEEFTIQIGEGTKVPKAGETYIFLLNTIKAAPDYVSLLQMLPATDEQLATVRRLVQTTTRPAPASAPSARNEGPAKQ